MKSFILQILCRPFKYFIQKSVKNLEMMRDTKWMSVFCLIINIGSTHLIIHNMAIMAFHLIYQGPRFQGPAGGAVSPGVISDDNMAAAVLTVATWRQQYSPQPDDNMAVLTVACSQSIFHFKKICRTIIDKM